MSSEEQRTVDWPISVTTPAWVIAGVLKSLRSGGFGLRFLYLHRATGEERRLEVVGDTMADCLAEARAALARRHDLAVASELTREIADFSRRNPRDAGDAPRSGS